MEISYRVRAFLLTGRSSLLFIKRIKADIPPYWTIPGGGIEASDSSPEAALEREVLEEVGGRIEIIRPVLAWDIPFTDEIMLRQTAYLCYLLSYDLSLRTGPELTDPSRGLHIPEEIPLDAAHLDEMIIQPPMLKPFLLEHAEDWRRL